MRNKKKIFVISAIIILLLFILVLISANFIILSPGNDIKKLSQSLQAEANQYKNYLSVKQFDLNLVTLQNSKLNNKDRYSALEKDINMLFNAYGLSNNPNIRKYVASLIPLVKKAFPKEFKQETFQIPCSDPECGDKIDSEMNELIKQINKLPVEKRYIDTITLNLKLGTFKPKNDQERKFGKYISYQLAFNQLKKLNNKEASQSAQKLKSYVKEKFNIDIYETK